MKKLAVCLLVSLFFTVGCAKKSIKPAVSPQQPVTSADESQKDEPSIRYADWNKAPDLKTIYFDYDKSELTLDARQILQKNAVYLKNNEDLMILIAGHCDERGTTEYNLALGQRRATIVREYYGKLGLPLTQVGTISYGKEKPEDLRNSEEGWALNRRAETRTRVRK
ncbi:MAG: OmpA family protein [Elusimicrobia bacterium]|nr:OmpA family protein [Elusimicrobiota bacterium]